MYDNIFPRLMKLTAHSYIGLVVNGVAQTFNPSTAGVAAKDSVVMVVSQLDNSDVRHCLFARQSKYAIYICVMDNGQLAWFYQQELRKLDE